MSRAHAGLAFLPVHRADFAVLLEVLEGIDHASFDAVLCLGIINTIYEGYYEKVCPKVWSEDEIKTAANGHPQAWVVFMMADYIKHVNPEVMTYVRGACQDMKWFSGTLRGGEVYTCHIPMTAGEGTEH